MYNFVFDTENLDSMTPVSEGGGCFLYFYLEEGQISYRLACSPGREEDMAMLLTAIHTFECYSAAVDGVTTLVNGESILDKHDVFMEIVNEDNLADDLEYTNQEEFDDHALSPIVPPLNVYSSSFGESFGSGDDE